MLHCLKRDNVKKTYTIILDIIELYLPAVTFTVMFTVFILQIVFRYVLNAPLMWAYEVTVLCFIWTTLLAACYIRRIKGHINFNMFYLSRKPGTQTAFRFISNGLILFVCVIGYLPTIDYIDFLKMDKSPVLRLPMNIGFFPILVFLTLIGLHSLEDIMRDIKLITEKRGAKR